SIKILYEDQPLDYIGPRSVTYSWTHGEIDSDFHNIVFERIKTVTKRIDKIQLNNNEAIHFGYETIQRVDLPGSYALSAIYRTNQSVITDKYLFSFKYLYKNELKPYDQSFSIDEKRYARLALREIRKAGKAEQD